MGGILSGLFGGASGGGRKFLLIGGAVATVAAVWFIARWASAPMYVTLYHDLDFARVAPIQESLEKAGIPNRLGTSGTEVLVPVGDVARARVALAKDGQVTTGRPGLELFDKPSWGMTDFSQRVTYQRALEGELARTIGRIRGITAAQVHIVIPTPSPLRSLDRPASASVVLTLKPGLTLPPEAIHGIAYIVSNSVDRLPSDNVAIMDDAGHVLSVPAGEPTASAAVSRQLEMQRALEQSLTEKVQGLLTPLVGADHSRTEVTAELNFDQVDRTVETIGGAPDLGLDTLEVATANSHELERSVSSAGRLVRLTAAVVVDATVLGTEPDTRMRQIEAVVRDGIGVDSTRGDRLSVVASAFEQKEAEETEEAEAAGEKTDIFAMADRFIRPLVGLVAVAVLALFGLRLLRAQLGSPQAAAPGRAVAVAGAARAALPAAGGAAPAAAEAGGRDPDTLLRVVHDWLKES